MQINYRTKREEIAEQIRRDVLSRKLTRGTSLREESLAQRFGVSRIPVRDALLQLTQEGILVAQPNCGVRVASMPDDEIQPLIVKLRRQIEGFALDLLFARVADVDTVRLRQILKAFKAACKTGDAAKVVPCDMAFHRFIIDEANCPKLLPIWLPIVSRMMLHYSRHSEWMESYMEHEAIAEGIFKGDRKEARRRLIANIK